MNRSKKAFIRVVFLGADEPIKVSKESGSKERPDDSREKCSDETLPCLIRAETGQRLVNESPTEQKSPEISHNIVADNESARKNEPDEPTEDVGQDYVRLDDDVEEHENGPRDLSELILV